MDDERLELVRVDATGTAHPVGKTASQRLRARQGAFRVMPSPTHLIVMRYVGEDGRRDPQDGPVFRLSGEITAAGALCDIVSLIGQVGWKGELLVLDGQKTRSIFFEHGLVVGAQSSAEGERIGDVLYRYGALTREQIAATAAAASADTRFGEAAVKLGFLARETLYQLMARQTEEIVYAVLLVEDGMFYFLETYDEARLPTRQSLSASAVLMEGVRRMDETRYFRDRIPSDQHVPTRVPGRFPPEPPEPELQDVLAAIDGARSVADLGRVLGLGEFEVTRALFQLVQSGRVVVRAPRPTGAAAIVAVYNQAISAIFLELDLVDSGGEVREQLASFATGAGIYDALFRKAGPSDDGTLLPDRVIENIGALVGPGQAESMLAQWLHEYLSFAMFVAEPHLRPGPDATPSSRRGESASPASVLRKRVTELISPLSPKR